MFKQHLAVLVAAELAFTGVVRADSFTISQQVPFTNTIFIDSTSESVTLSGNLHVVVKMTLPPRACTTDNPCTNVPITVYTNLDNVAGKGSTTGNPYQSTGTFINTGEITVPGQLQFAPTYQIHTVEGDLIEWIMLAAIVALASPSGSAPPINVTTGGGS